MSWIGEWTTRSVAVELDDFPESEAPYVDDRLELKADGSFALRYLGGTFTGAWREQGRSALAFSDIQQLNGDELREIRSDGPGAIRAHVYDREHGYEIWYRFQKT